jgi:predicted transcriptional regulator
MTIQVPDDLAREIERLAAARGKSIEQMAVEKLRFLCGARSPTEVLRAIRELPHPSLAAADAVEAAITEARLPTLKGPEV